jgi:hypothetical protein
MCKLAGMGQPRNATCRLVSTWHSCSSREYLSVQDLHICVLPNLPPWLKACYCWQTGEPEDHLPPGLALTRHFAVWPPSTARSQCGVTCQKLLSCRIRLVSTWHSCSSREYLSVQDLHLPPGLALTRHFAVWPPSTARSQPGFQPGW